MAGQRHVGANGNQKKDRKQSNGPRPAARNLLTKTTSNGREDNRPKKSSDSDNGSSSSRDDGHLSTQAHDDSRKYINKMNSNSNKPSLMKFKDAASNKAEDARRENIKNALIEGITAEKLEKYRKSKDELKEIKNKKIRGFYESQNEKLTDWLEVDTLVEHMACQIFDSFDPDRDHDGQIDQGRGGALQSESDDLEALLPEDERKSRQDGERKAKWAINVNVIANILLLTAKVVAVFTSSSLSLIASTVDSALDLLCTLIVWTTNRLVRWRLDSMQRKFPVGRKRLEPLGILVFSILMVISFLQILQESVTKLLPKGDHSIATLPIVAVAAMGGTIVIKGIIWIGCAKVKTTQVQALAQDCRTDVVFNSLSLIFPAIGSKFGIWWLDPAGAACLSLFIIYDWAGTCFEQVINLSGSSIEQRVESKLIFMCYRFSPIVRGFKALTAYHAGDGIWVEVDLLLDPDSKLIEAHDVAECLQYCLEGLTEVDRAFVTCDYATEGPTGHSAAGA